METQVNQDISKLGFCDLHNIDLSPYHQVSSIFAPNIFDQMFIDAVNLVIDTKKRGAHHVDIRDILHDRLPHPGLVFIVTHDLLVKGTLFINQQANRQVSYNSGKYLNKLSSPKESLQDEDQWMIETPPMFLDGHPLNNRILLATFPRTGNSFLRQYLENITNIVTGTDMDFAVNYELGLNGFKGEGHVDDRVWIQKSHYPL
ncbi:UNKNOWN [Stylonychia lemnae]|uniref:Uncharacterized protein n=1 Tax=Stylonychia lemnae TaxID=5949 RepID=A0A078ATS9_STYLE|nr:UNKNOWN [Stylonychia lemnae]|eukprot:CDW84253.1 UNKNOWN [Stylonychia lemnae]